MLALVDFSFEFGGRYLYNNASWHIKPNEKIGLVGLNGTGKSTLLRVIAGEYDLREGKVSRPADLRIGFFNQDLLSTIQSGSVLDAVLSGREDLVEIDRELHKVIAKVEKDPSEKNLHRMADLQEEFSMKGGYDWQSEGEKILEGLGFSTEDLTSPLETFSGGWRMRALLAKMLLQEPDLLLLDEPTNHLDLPTIQWLEEYLKEYKGTFIIVSHDRLFLDNTVNRIAEVAHQTLYHYKGNFSDFLEQKHERDELMSRRFENQQDYIRQQMRFIERFRSKASKATAVQSRVKMLDKLEKIDLKQDDSREMNIRFNIRVNPGKLITGIKHVNKNFGNLQIFKDATAAIYRGDRIALIGANGKGKSTLLRMIFGTESYTGEIEKGHNVQPSFYAQHQLEALNLKNDLIQELGSVGGEYTEYDLRTTLGCFLFTGDDVFKKVKVLSGGEKSRLALAKTLLTQSNFMLLDEPTNHLDMFSTAVLAEALEAYKGSCIFVSHDRTFVSKVANKIWWLENGKIREFDGGYEEYKEWVATRPAVKEGPVRKTVEAAVKEVPKAQPEPRSSKNTLQMLEKKVEEIDVRMKLVLAEKQEIEQELQDPSTATKLLRIAELGDAYKACESKLQVLQKDYDTAFTAWMEAQ